MSKTEIVLGAFKFKTKKSIKDFLGKLYAEKGMGFIVCPGDEYYQFFFDLLKRHPDYDFKTRNGIHFFRFGSNPLHNFIELQVVGLDNEYEPFSPAEAISGRLKKDNRLNEAMRLAVEHHIDYFINTNPKPKTCSLCKQDKDFYHVDHVVKFRHLAQDFNQDRITPVDFERTKDFRWEFLDSDVDYSAAWQDYHMKYAVLRWICSNCNFRIG